MKTLSIIPLPEKIIPGNGVFQWKKDSSIACIYSEEKNSPEAAWLCSFMQSATGIRWLTDDNPHIAAPIRLLKNKNEKSCSEAYALSVSRAGITLSATHNEGIFRGIQTLRQILPAESEKNTGLQQGFSIPCLEISDSPRYEWRGFMLDEARHFLGGEAVKKILDALALLKINRFHWHLNDDQGWRVEIKNYPELTATGSKRRNTVLSRLNKNRLSGKPHEGYYTREDIRDIIRYAALRHIEVVPEFEMPGHCGAALASIPSLGCTGGPYAVQEGPGIFKDIYCAGRENVFEFIENVLGELADIFPSPYLHTGGDEAPKDRWELCPQCRQRMRDHGLNGLEALQAYFTERVHRIVRGTGKIPVSWNESMNSGNPGDSIIQFWMGDSRALAASMKQGRKVILSPVQPLYLDYSHSMHSLKSIYSFEPECGDFSGTEGSILGIEAPLWTEFVPTPGKAEALIFPRLCALSERAWSAAPDARDYRAFRKRLTVLCERLTLMGYALTTADKWDPFASKFTAPLEKAVSRILSKFYFSKF